MMISQTVEYALRAMVHLAAEPLPRTAAQIAEVTKVPAAYLVKVLQQLARAKLVHGQRGPNGGFTLMADAAEITIWMVVDAVEPLQRIRSCPLELKTHRVRLCPLHQKLDDALAQIEHAFKETTLAEWLGDPDAPRPLCDVRPVSRSKGRVSLH